MTQTAKRRQAKFQWNAARAGRPEKAVVLVPDQTGARNARADAALRSRSARLEEATGLARAIGLDVVEAGTVPIRAVRPATLFGAGKVDEVAGLMRAAEAGLAIVDHPLTPVQQRNLEKAWNAKVLDRTGLILEIFGERARTKEGRLQVELARLNYQKGRLVRTWTHLERQRGALGFVGGPGETQIEADRRMIAQRIRRLEADLEKVRRTRTLHRSKRKKVPHPVVALVGYTNAGKSTLFNRLTGSQVTAKDQLFATLDPTLRRLALPSGREVIASDTVGFVSDLPTDLIAAFRATLEEVVEADLIVHVRDIASEDTAAQAEDVERVLGELGIDNDERIIEVWNKVDLLDEEARASMLERCTQSQDERRPIAVSALTGDGLDQLIAAIDEHTSREPGEVEITLAPDRLAALGWIYDNTQVIDRADRDDGSVAMRLRATPRLLGEIRRLGL